MKKISLSLLCALFCLSIIETTLAAETSVHRFYSSVYGAHFYTLSESEKDHLIATDRNWSYEGVVTKAETTPVSGTTPLYRFWSENYGAHFYTLSESEKNTLIATDQNWSYEGIAYHVYSSNASGRSAVYRFWSPDYQAHFYTQSPYEKTALEVYNPEWSYEGVAYYADNSLLGNGTILSHDFSALPVGAYSAAAALSDTGWKKVAWASLGQRATITSAEKLQMTYPAGAFGSNESGGQILVNLRNSYHELYLSYDVYFASGFDWQRGGKLPGLSSDGATWTGGNKPWNGGFSTRYMWRDDGRAIIYLYHRDQATSFGDEIDLGFSFDTEKTYTLTQHVKRNTGDSANGILEVWLSTDGGAQTKVLERNNIRFGLSGNGFADSLLFSTFYGGGDSSWAPDTTGTAVFDNFGISLYKPAFLP